MLETISSPQPTLLEPPITTPTSTIFDHEISTLEGRLTTLEGLLLMLPKSVLSPDSINGSKHCTENSKEMGLSCVDFPATNLVVRNRVTLKKSMNSAG